MNEWKDEWMRGWMNKWMYEWMNEMIPVDESENLPPLLLQ